MVSEIEVQLGIKLLEDDRAFLEASRQLEAENIKAGKWHCYDIPFLIECGDEETGRKIVSILNQYDLKTQIKIGW